jgi:hypothetical protein
MVAASDAVDSAHLSRGGRGAESACDAPAALYDCQSLSLLCLHASVVFAQCALEAECLCAVFIRWYVGPRLWCQESDTI